MTTATTDAPAPEKTGADAALEVVLAFSTLDAYRAMGAELDKVRAKLKLPTWSTPTEVIAAALQQAAT
ncbi:MAG TPA: hypothetical protein VF125_05985 [Solirubrobacterales bacterium]